LASVKKGNGIGCEFGPEKKAMDPEDTIAGGQPIIDKTVTPGAETPPEDSPADQATSQKPSPALLSAISSSLSDLQANVQAGLGMIEDPEVEAFLTGDFATACGELQTMVDGLLASKGGKADSPDVPADPPPDAETMKTWLAGGSARGHLFTGFAAKLATIAKSSKPLTPGQKRDLEQVVSGIRKGVTESRGIAKTIKADDKAKQDAEQATKDAELATKVESVAKTFESLATGLKSLVPSAA
jgi:hypothetical protein